MPHQGAPHFSGVHTQRKGMRLSLHSPPSEPHSNKSNCKMGIMQPNTSAAEIQGSELHSTGIALALKIACAGCALLHVRNPFFFFILWEDLQRKSKHLKRNSLLLMLFFFEPISAHKYLITYYILQWLDRLHQVSVYVLWLRQSKPEQLHPAPLLEGLLCRLRVQRHPGWALSHKTDNKINLSKL